ncbi:arsenate reductase (glutaredoxin) [Reichenbachiella carrageenanivorans]|uniref:Arsenate reductase (Glutaredoxin) n=1 Tax=Reichenbachiella carrageenanivorans TaxID=2979869 RepID=A0ABY6D2V5_9BACT|nr:arsenate reductase (glutaredoxin) [Reichenbachiella carrageenanivorans]UXX79428.1 arsenate reductase (glutaredoxin) [Reichenbachiella carrageenanivorans]
MTKIYHNPRCSKSRQALALLEEKNENIEIIEYLKSSPTKAELTELVAMLGISPLDLIRKGEAIYKEEYKGKDLNDEAWIDAMVAHPILIERPVVVKNGKAAIGRPIEKVIDIL